MSPGDSDARTSVARQEDIRCDEVADPEIEAPRDAIKSATVFAICGSDLRFYHTFIPAMLAGDVWG